MLKVITAAAIASSARGACCRAEDRAGRKRRRRSGLAVGAIVGSQMNHDDGYRGYGYRHRARTGIAASSAANSKIVRPYSRPQRSRLRLTC
jgi:hypothetical protein